MIHLILGINKEKTDKEISRISKKDPIWRIDAFSWNTDLFISELGSASLFSSEEKKAIVLDNISENEEAWTAAKEIFTVEIKKEIIVLEHDLKKEDLEFFENINAEISDFREKKEFAYDFSPFALQDAVGGKSAKKSWIEYIKLRNQNIEAEEIIPKVISKLRDMLAISKGANKEDLNIKSDYPYNKSKRDFKNWEIKSLKNLYSNLIYIYHEARMGGEDLETALEKELLKL